MRLKDRTLHRSQRPCGICEGRCQYALPNVVEAGGHGDKGYVQLGYVTQLILVPEHLQESVGQIHKTGCVKEWEKFDIPLEKDGEILFHTRLQT